MTLVDDISYKQSSLDMLYKKLLSNSQIVSRIAKCFVKECEDLTIKEIEQAICQTQITTNREDITIHGQNTTVQSFYEGYINFDILVKLDIPKINGGSVRIFLNLEPQKNPYPGYPIVTRGIVYACMMVDRQYKEEFDASTYKDVKKVYSIWVLPQSSKQMDGLVRQYCIHEKILKGDRKKRNRKENYDKIEVVEIYSSPKINILEISDEVDEIIKLIKTLFDRELKKEEKIERFKELGLNINEDIEVEVNEMCNLAEGLVEETRSETRENERKYYANKLAQSVKDKVLSASQAADILDMTEKEFELYLQNNEITI